MSKHLGTELDGKPLDLDLETLLRGRLLITASSGAGKTGTLLEFCELNAGKVQIIAFDPEGEFAVLRTKFPFVLVGPEGETPALVRSAPLLATRLLELGASAILDIYELPTHQKHEFVRDFLNAMIDAPKRLWRPVIVIVDEAHMFAPEGKTGESVAAQAMADLASRGRKRGYCAVLATQRLAKLSKNVAAECQNVLVGRTTQVDQDRAADVLNLPAGKANRNAFYREVSHLPDGSFFAYGMAFRRELPTRFAVNRPETMPKPGAKRLAPPPAPSAIQALLPKLSDLPAEAENKAKTEAELRKEITDLKRQLRAQPPPSAIIPKSVENERIRMLTAQINTLQKTAGAYERAMVGILRLAEDLTKTADRIKDAVQQAQGAATLAQDAAAVPQATVAAVSVPARQAAPARAAQPTPKREIDPDSRLSGPEQKILDSLLWFKHIGVAGPDNTAVAFMAGYTVNGSFHNARAKLKNAGLAGYLDGGRMEITAAGVDLANPPTIGTTNEDLHAAVLARLGGPEVRVLKPLLEAYPRGIATAELAEKAGYTENGSFFNARGKLKTLGLIRYEGGTSVANDLLFPEGQ